MSTSISFFLNCIPKVSIWLTRNGQEFRPEVTGRIGQFALSDDVRINVSIIGDHKCFILDPNDYAKQIPLPEIGMGIYEKKINISVLDGARHIAKWPKNMICVEIEGQRYNIGIADQSGIFYFVIEKPGIDDYDKIPVRGTVRWFSPLRGYGAVANNNLLFDARVHWSALPKRKNGLRYLLSGEKVTWADKDLEQLFGKTAFEFEVNKAELC